MRKILVIALMVALIPFTTGCRLFGDYDSDGADLPTTTTTSNVTTIQPTITLAGDGTSVSNNIKAAYSLTGATVFIVESDGITENSTTATFTGTIWKFTANSAIAKTKFTSDGTNYKIKIKIKFANGKSAFCDTLVPVAIQGTTSTATNADNVTVSLTLALSATGEVTYTYTVTYTAVGATTTTTVTVTVTATGTSTATGTTATSFGTLFVEKITYAGTTETTLDSAGTVTGVDFATASFKVYFNTAVAAIPTTYSLSASNGVTTVSFSSSDNGVATASLDSTGKIMTLTVWGQKGTTKLDPNTTYTVTFTSATIYKSGSTTVTATIAEAGTTYKFTTAKAALASYDAKNSAGTSVKSGTTTVTVGSTAATISLTFNYGVTKPSDLLTASTYVFSKTKNGGTASTGTFANFFSAAALSTDAKTLTLTLKNALTAGTYVITYSSGSFTDANGKALDTTTSTTFTVN